MGTAIHTDGSCEVKTCLVTGSSGFLATHLKPKLKQAGYIGYYCDKDKGYAFDIFNLLLRISDGDCVHGDEIVNRRFDVVIHLAAYIPPIDERLKFPLKVYTENMKIDATLVDYVDKNPPREKLILMSSCSVDSAETDPYAANKQHLERVARALVDTGVPTTVLRPFSGYGTDQSRTYPFKAILLRALAKENPLTVFGRGTQVRDWVHVEDLTDAIVQCIGWPSSGTPVEIGTGIGTDFLTLARMIADEVGYNPEIRGLTEMPESSPKRIANTALAAQHGWRPKITLAEGIKMAVEAMRASK